VLFVGVSKAAIRKSEHSNVACCSLLSINKWSLLFFFKIRLGGVLINLGVFDSKIVALPIYVHSIILFFSILCYVGLVPI